ncbi:MAG: crosslink repair DNA glycosylase YcaQ family protein [Polyangiaceae bacterium]
MKSPKLPSTFPLRAVAALFLARQHLDKPRGRRLTAENLRKFAADTGGLQIDSINVVDRAHYITAWNRFGPYDRAKLDKLCYQRRVLFEYWAHAACLISVEHFAWWRRAMLDYSTRTRGWGTWLKKNRALVSDVEKALADRGPLGSADFGQDRQKKTTGWWNWKPTTHALDYLWMSGRTLVHSRSHFQKRFDLAERVLPDLHAVIAPSADEFRKWHVRQSLHAMGAASATDLRAYLSFPRGSMMDRKRILADMLASGEVVRIDVESVGKGREAAWYALSEDLPNLAEAARRKSPSRGTAILTPFDSFLWHRERTARLFGFDYRIEVYTPGHKRVHGYYVMPILHDGQLIGRVDAKVHRAHGELEVKRIHFEPWFVRGQAPPAASWGSIDRDAAFSGVAEALRSLAKFAGTPRVSLGQISPTSLKLPFQRALAASAAV